MQFFIHFFASRRVMHSITLSCCL